MRVISSFTVVFDILCKIRLEKSQHRKRARFKRVFFPQQRRKETNLFVKTYFFITRLKLCLLFSFQNYVNVEDCLEAYESEKNT